jgi:hypothetical protein
MSRQVFEKKFSSIYVDSKKCDAKTFIESRLDGDDYERGAIESARAQGENVSVAFARLIQILFDKKVLTQAEVEKIAGLR